MKYFRIIKFINFIIIGVLLGVFHEFIINNLSFTLPIIIVLYGIEATVISIVYHKKDFYIKHRFYWGLVEILLGLVVLFYIIDFETTCIVWAIWALLREAGEFREAVDTLDSLITSIILIATGIVNVVFSILLVMHPGVEHATTHLYLLIVELVVNSGIPLIDYYVYGKDNTEKMW